MTFFRPSFSPRPVSSAKPPQAVLNAAAASGPGVGGASTAQNAKQQQKKIEEEASVASSPARQQVPPEQPQPPPPPPPPSSWLANAQGQMMYPPGQGPVSGQVSKAASGLVLRKTATEALAGALPARLIHRLIPSLPESRELTPEELAEIEEKRSRLLPTLVQTPATPVMDLLSSPEKQGLLAGLIGAVGGGLLGYNFGGPVGAIVGGSIAGPALGVPVWWHRLQKTDRLIDMIRRLPPGAVKRDYNGHLLLLNAMEKRFQGDKIASASGFVKSANWLRGALLALQKLGPKAKGLVQTDKTVTLGKRLMNSATGAYVGSTMDSGDSNAGALIGGVLPVVVPRGNVLNRFLASRAGTATVPLIAGWKAGRSSHTLFSDNPYSSPVWGAAGSAGVLGTTEGAGLLGHLLAAVPGSRFVRSVGSILGNMAKFGVPATAFTAGEVLENKAEQVQRERAAASAGGSSAATQPFVQPVGVPLDLQLAQSPVDTAAQQAQPADVPTNAVPAEEDASPQKPAPVVPEDSGGNVVHTVLTPPPKGTADPAEHKRYAEGVLAALPPGEEKNQLANLLQRADRFGAGKWFLLSSLAWFLYNQFLSKNADTDWIGPAALGSAGLLWPLLSSFAGGSKK